MSKSTRKTADKIVKMASDDATKYAGLEMAHGRSAGNALWVLDGEVRRKSDHLPGYKETFEAFYAKQDWVALAERMSTQRKKLMSNTGRLPKISLRDPRVRAIVIVAGVARVTGYDKRAWAKVKQIKAQVLHDKNRTVNIYNGPPDGSA